MGPKDSQLTLHLRWMPVSAWSTIGAYRTHCPPYAGMARQSQAGTRCEGDKGALRLRPVQMHHVVFATSGAVELEERGDGFPVVLGI
jgi:hypothetical protein